MQPVDFFGFAADCTITGKVTMFGERLTDFLNGQERFRLHHVECESLADGHLAAVDSISVERTELLCVMATGPRGSEKQRVSLSTNRLQAHRAVPDPRPAAHEPGTDAMASVLQRDPMIPFTNATIAYEVAGSIVARDIATVIVNRLLVDWISPTTEAASLFPDTRSARRSRRSCTRTHRRHRPTSAAVQRGSTVPRPSSSARRTIAAPNTTSASPTPRWVATTRPDAGRGVPARIASPSVAVGSG